MSCNIYAFLKHYPETFADLSTAIEELGIPKVSLQTDALLRKELLRDSKGSIVIVLDGKEAFPELHTRSLSDISEFFHVLPVDGRTFVIHFRWGADWRAATCATAACAALIKKYDALVYVDIFGQGLVDFDGLMSEIQSMILANGSNL